MNSQFFSIRFSVNVVMVTLSLSFMAVLLGAESVKAGVASFALIIPSLFIASYLVISFYYSVRGLEVTEHELIIHHPLKKLAIPLENISKIETQENIKLKKIAPLFGYYGKMSSPQIGFFRSLVTHPDDMVLVTTLKNRYLLSPKDKTAFVDHIRSKSC